MKYVDQLDAVGRAAMEIGVEAGMQKISDMFLAALAQEASAKSGFTGWRAACPNWTRNLTARMAADRKRTGFRSGWTRFFARPAARTLSRSANETRTFASLTTRRYQPGARKNDLDLWRGLLP